MVSTYLVIPEDPEELALTLNGKKRKIKKEDFIIAMSGAGLVEKVIANIFMKFKNVQEKWFSLIEESFISKELKIAYIDLIKEKLARL